MLGTYPTVLAIMPSMRIPVTDQWWSPFRKVGAVEILYVELAPHSKNEAVASTLLSDGERRRADRFLYPGPRRRYILLRAALRYLLCDRLGCDNDALSFPRSTRGKPYAVVHGVPASIQFNVSDSGDHGLIAIAPVGSVGIDVEERSVNRDLDGLAEMVFDADEQASMLKVSGERKVERFYRLWTAKEALVKALGTGLYLDVSTFQAPLALLRGSTGAEFRFPHLPEVAWWVEDLGTSDFAAAIAHEMTAGDGAAVPGSGHVRPAVEPVATGGSGSQSRKAMGRRQSHG